jgi:hypothetical protein
MKLHHIFGAACVLGGTLALSSCEKYDELFPAQYHCVLNIKDAGIRNTELYTTEAEGTTPVSIMKTGSKGDVPANGTLVPMAAEAFQAYCTNNALKYAYLPAEYYSLPNEELQFSAQERYKIINVVLKTREISKLQESNHGQKYALPLLLHGNGASVHDSLLIIAPDIKAPSLELTSAGSESVNQTGKSCSVAVGNGVGLKLVCLQHQLVWRVRNSQQDGFLRGFDFHAFHVRIGNGKRKDIFSHLHGIPVESDFHGGGSGRFGKSYHAIVGQGVCVCRKLLVTVAVLCIVFLESLYRFIVASDAAFQSPSVWSGQGQFHRMGLFGFSLGSELDGTYESGTGQFE